jgi:hypothetical protein
VFSQSAYTVVEEEIPLLEATGGTHRHINTKTESRSLKPTLGNQAKEKSAQRFRHCY